ncbi:MAG: hypothetical protein MI747_04570 [Desulfobacterales bacterium]|nr:hypothetical protein [Desulfobacterales bacterium]
MTSFTTYLDQIARANGLPEDIQWLFYPGMLQDSPDKWWDDWKFRHALHEGVDICFYRRSAGELLTLGPNARIPALCQGIIRNICPDFLGHSLIIEPTDTLTLPRRIIWVYSHQTSMPGLAPGDGVEKGQIISRIFDTRKKKSKLLSHLHLSCIEISREIPFGDLNWNLFPRRDQVNLINPMFFKT